jgi:hypothetical protein
MKRVFLLLVFCCVLFVPVIVSADNVQPAPAGTVRIYRDYLCSTGPQTTFGSGEYPSLVNHPQHDESGSPIPNSSWNDQISCLTIGEGIREITVYEHINFKGKKLTLKRTKENPLGVWSFSQTWWNDRISSMKIFK